MNEYRYERFTTRLLFRDLRFASDSAAPGDSIPDFELITTDGKRLKRSDVFRDKPVLIIFGSMTCPMTASAAPTVQALYEEFGDRIEFIMMYVREAHPGERFSQPDSIADKLEHSEALKEFYDIDWVVAADNIDGDLHRVLDPKPNSAYLMDSGGTILYRSLWAADGRALHDALDAVVAGRILDNQQSVAFIGPVIRAMGQVQAVMERGGPQAVSDLWRAGFPMAFAGRVATLFSPLSPDQRGIAAVLTLLLVTLTVMVMLSVWAFT